MDYFCFFGDMFAFACLDGSKVWMWKLLKNGEQFKMKCWGSVSVNCPSFLQLTQTHLAVGQIGGTQMFSLETFSPTAKKKDSKAFFLILPQLNEVKTKDILVVGMYYVTSDCVLVVDSRGLMYAANVHDNKIVQLMHPFKKIEQLSVVIRPASRTDETTISAALVALVDKQSIYILSLKHILASLELKLSTYTEQLTPTKAIFTEHSVDSLVTVAPDCLFVASNCQLYLYLLSWD